VIYYRGKTELSFHEITKQMGLNLLDENGSFSESKIPAIPQFLNRLLSLKTHQQNAVFGEFENRLVEAVEYAKQRGFFDVGLQTLTAMSIQKTRDDVAYERSKNRRTNDAMSSWPYHCNRLLRNGKRPQENRRWSP